MWAPQLPGLAEWMRITMEVQRGNGGEPFAGRYLRTWALEAGFVDVTSSASVWCFASDEERRWWGELWSERVTESDWGAQAREAGVADAATLATVSRAWLEWAADASGWYGMPHGEIVARG